MHFLTRSVRFAVNAVPGARGSNGFAGSPPLVGFGRWFELDVTCRGTIDPVTGYLIDIKAVDNAVRRHVVPLFERDVRAGGRPVATLRDAAAALVANLPVAPVRVCVRLSPYHDFEMSPSDPTHALIRQRFDFSAAHRLHSPALTDAENQSLYGKCNNPRGHGHNYVLQPTVRIRLGANPEFSVADLEDITAEAVIRHFDHKHLNEDTEEFAVDRGGVLPSVENIARVCFERLRPAIATHPAGPTLESVTVWETDRTSATYPA